MFGSYRSDCGAQKVKTLRFGWHFLKLRGVRTAPVGIHIYFLLFDVFWESFIWITMIQPVLSRKLFIFQLVWGFAGEWKHKFSAV
jgi:hypothetical protein